MRRIKILTFLICFFLTKISVSVTWTTVSPGFWNDPTVWSTNIVPPYSSSDTFHIEHPVAFQNNLFFNNSAFLKIDSTGGLCGHHNITAATGSEILKYGIIELDTMNIPGGQVNFYPPGQVIFTMYGIISNGGSLSNHGNSLAVGPWFECMQPAFSFTIGIIENTFSEINLFPNPASTNFSIVFNSYIKEATILVTDLLGRKIYQRSFSGSELNITDIDWPDGIYFWKIISDEQHPISGKIQIIK